MSHGHRTLVVALVGVLLLLGLTQLIDTRSTSSISAPGTEGAVADASTSSILGITDIVDGDTSTTSTSAPPVTADCTIETVLREGSVGPEVTCLERQLLDGGFATVPADAMFDATTDLAVRAYQEAEGLEVDGVVGRQTAQRLGIWAGPLGPMPATDDDCPDTPHGAIVDRANQRGHLCTDGVITYTFPITTAQSQPDPGTYPVYAKDMNSSSTFSGAYSTMTHFVAFTRGKYKGARIAFHSVPKYQNGEWIQPLDSVGTMEYFGESSGCIRVLPDDAVRIWDFLQVDDEVRVIS